MATNNPLPPPAEYSVVVSQYSRDDFGVGTEQELHWAILVITNEAAVRGPCYQVTNFLYPDRPLQWSIHLRDEITLFNSAHCLGGVRIGRVRAEEFEQLNAMLSAHKPVPKQSGWNCRSWVMECIAMMKEKGWIVPHITDQESILRGMKVASVKSREALRNGRTPTLVSLLEPPA